MNHLPLATNETGRLKALHDYYILDTLAEDEFDRFTQLIAIICDTPISLISLLDEKRQWFKSRVGLDVEQTPRHLAFCQYTMAADEIFQVNDATADDRFKHNDLVTGNPNIKFYAGYPLIDPNGYALGSLCVIDKVPRNLSAAQEKALQLLAEEVTERIVRRRERQELQNFKTVFDLSDDLVCIAGFDGYFKSVNPAFARLLGFTEKYFLETPFLQQIHPDDVAATDNESRTLRQGNVSLDFINRYRTKSGTYKTIHWTTSPEEGQPFLYAIGRDITRQQQQDQLLAASESKFRSFFENSQGFMYTHNMQGRFLSINKSGAATLGLDAAEIQNVTLFDIIPEHKHNDLRKYLTYILLRLKANSLMTTVDATGCKRVWAYSNVLLKDEGGNDYVLGNSIDLTERLQLERELKQTRKILEQTNKAARVGGWEYDVVQDTIYWSAVTREIHEVDEDYQPQLSTSIAFYKEGASRENISKAMNEAMTTGIGWDLELELITAKGRALWVRALGEPEMNNGVCVRVFGTFQDINNKKHEALKAEKLALQIRRQNDNLLNFAHIVSHNLRSHTGNLKMILQLINEEEDDTEKLSYLSHLDTVSATLDETIENLTEVVKVQTDLRLEKSPVDLEKYFTLACNTLSATIEKEKASVTADFGVATINHIPAYIESIMLNFISNAIKYKHPDRTPVVQVTSFLADGNTCLTFADNGLGIDLQKHGDKIFGMYKTFHHHPDARGIGLFMTRNQVEATGGTITVQSKVGKGTVFKIVF